MFRPDDIIEARKPIWTDQGLVPAGDIHVVDQVSLSGMFVRPVGAGVFTNAAMWELVYRPGEGDL